MGDLAAFLVAIAVVMVYLYPLGRAGYLILSPFGRGREGAWLSISFGPLGLVVAWVMRANIERERHDVAELPSEPATRFDAAWDTYEPERKRSFQWRPK